MRVELHGVSHHVGHLVVAAIVEQFHRVQNAALHGFEAVAKVWHGTLKYDVRGIVKKPVLIHAGKLQLALVVLHPAGVIV